MKLPEDSSKKAARKIEDVPAEFQFRICKTCFWTTRDYDFVEEFCQDCEQHLDNFCLCQSPSELCNLCNQIQLFKRNNYFWWEAYYRNLPTFEFVLCDTCLLEEKFCLDCQIGSSLLCIQTESESNLCKKCRFCLQYIPFKKRYDEINDRYNF